ncbi:MAG: hypothetical protein FJ304_06560 [Planctomycetes bacterium]|nr:hypothetical protein [Planctomycetota bacterium]
MRKSRAITLTVLTGLMLTACCITMPGCGRAPGPDYTWYDASGNRIQERWKLDANGHKVLDAQGRPIPDPHVPYDKYHRPWVFVNGAWAPLSPPAGSSTRSRTSTWLWGGSGYRSSSSGGSSSYRSTSGSSSSPSSVSRGGFGSTGSGSSSS